MPMVRRCNDQDNEEQARPSAADLISLMSFFDWQEISEALVRNRNETGCRHGNLEGDDEDEEKDDDEDSASELSGNNEFEGDVLTLRNYSFISVNADKEKLSKCMGWCSWLRRSGLRFAHSLKYGSCSSKSQPRFLIGQGRGSTRIPSPRTKSIEEKASRCRTWFNTRHSWEAGCNIRTEPTINSSIGLRVSKISVSPPVNSQESHASFGIFTDTVGADATSTWAAATSGPTAVPVHLLACMLARHWNSGKATSI
jgi:hypothetical protein